MNSKPVEFSVVNRSDCLYLLHCQIASDLSLLSKDHDKINFFEKTLEDLDLVSNFMILSFNNKDIFYKVIYNGSPDKFINEIEASGLNLEKNDQTWQIK